MSSAIENIGDTAVPKRSYKRGKVVGAGLLSQLHGCVRLAVTLPWDGAKPDWFAALPQPFGPRGLQSGVLFSPGYFYFCDSPIAVKAGPSTCTHLGAMTTAS